MNPELVNNILDKYIDKQMDIVEQKIFVLQKILDTKKQKTITNNKE